MLRFALALSPAILLFQLSASALAQEGLTSTSSVTATALSTDQAMPELIVTGRRELQGTKYDQALLDIPQSVVPITQQVMQEQQASTLSEALRNAPSVSAAAGDPSSLGDRVRVRGFADQEGFFIDGLRDFGTYYRDPFDLQEVDVLEGPSGLLFGMGATGGSINQVSQQPGLAPSYKASLSLGTADTRRATLDLNQPLGSAASLRAGLVSDSGGVPGRDVVQYGLGGFAAGLAMGLGGPAQLSLKLSHLSESATPDMGLPWLYNSPAPVPASLYYGFADDSLRTAVDRGRADFILRLGSQADFSNKLQLQSATRSLRESIPSIANPAAPLSQMLVSLSTESIQSAEASLDDQADFRARLEAFGMSHDLKLGFELLGEASDPVTATFSGLPGESLLKPVESWDLSGAQNKPTSVTAAIKDGSAYVMDIASLGDRWQLVAGFRYDIMDSSYIKQQAGAATQSFSQQDGMPSWRAGAVFKPLPEGSLYAAFGNSYDPSAEQLSLSSATAGLPPEASTTSEIGVKWQLCHQQLLLSGALFKDEQANTRIPDPNNPLLDIDAGDELAQGWEVSASGRLARAWRLLAAYTHTDSQYVSYASGGHDFSGLPLAGTPQQSLNLWSALDLPWGFQLGAGAQALSGRNAGAFASNGSLEAVPGYAIYNAMLGWRPAKGLGIQLNVNNATNLSYISGVDDSHITPGAARAFILSGAMEY